VTELGEGAKYRILSSVTSGRGQNAEYSRPH